MPVQDVEGVEDLAKVMRALGDPVRIRILRLVSEQGEQTCGPLAEMLELPQSTLSRHLRILRDAGLTYSRPEGLHRWVGIKTEDLEHRYPGLLNAVLLQDAETS